MTTSQTPTSAPSFPGGILAIAEGYVRQGLAVIPIPYMQKGAVLPGWPKLRLSLEDLPPYFDGSLMNIGVLLGEPSGNLVDIDLDTAEAIDLAPEFLSPTATFGRASRPRSHHLYRSHAVASRSFKDVSTDLLGGQRTGAGCPAVALVHGADLRDAERVNRVGKDRIATLLEIRSNRDQTVFPGSTHPSGEVVAWSEGVDPNQLASAVVRVEPANINDRCLRLAVATLLVRAGRPRADAIAAARGDLHALDGPLGDHVRRWLGGPRAPQPVGVAKSSAVAATASRPISPLLPRLGEARSNDPARQFGALMAAHIREQRTFHESVDQWNRDHPGDWPPNNGDCPADGHHKCFGTLPGSENKWHCFSTGHPSSVGRAGAKGYYGDALDLEAHARGKTPREVLIVDGYLVPPFPAGAPAPARTPASPGAPEPVPPTVEEILRSPAFSIPQAVYSTGFAGLDTLIGGGFHARQLAVIAASTGAGKTGLACTLARSLREQLPVLIVSTEIDGEEVAARIAGPVVGARPAELLALQASPQRAADAVKGWPIHILALDVCDESDLLLKIRRSAEAIRAAAGRAPIIFVDYLQMLASEDPDGRRMSVSKIANQLRRLARELDVPVIAISSVSRAYYGRSKLSLTDEEDPRVWLAAAKESGDIEYAAAVFVFLDTSTDVGPNGQSNARLIVAKSRRGRCGFVGARFDGPTGRFWQHDAAVAAMGPARRAADAEGKILEFVRKHPNSTKEVVRSQAGVGATKAGQVIETLVQQGVLNYEIVERKNSQGQLRKTKVLVINSDNVSRTNGDPASPTNGDPASPTNGDAASPTPAASPANGAAATPANGAAATPTNSAAAGTALVTIPGAVEPAPTPPARKARRKTGAAANPAPGAVSPAASQTRGAPPSPATGATANPTNGAATSPTESVPGGPNDN